MRSQWFVIHTLSGQEQKVKESIEKRLKPEEMGDYIKEVMVPMRRSLRCGTRKRPSPHGNPGRFRARAHALGEGAGFGAAVDRRIPLRKHPNRRARW